MFLLKKAKPVSWPLFLSAWVWDRMTLPLLGSCAISSTTGTRHVYRAVLVVGRAAAAVAAAVLVGVVVLVVVAVARKLEQRQQKSVGCDSLAAQGWHDHLCGFGGEAEAQTVPVLGTQSRLQTRFESDKTRWVYKCVRVHRLGEPAVRECWKPACIFADPADLTVTESPHRWDGGLCLTQHCLHCLRLQGFDWR